jgi:hypothetical protein
MMPPRLLTRDAAMMMLMLLSFSLIIADIDFTPYMIYAIIIAIIDDAITSILPLMPHYDIFAITMLPLRYDTLLLLRYAIAIAIFRFAAFADTFTPLRHISMLFAIDITPPLLLFSLYAIL